MYPGGPTWTWGWVCGFSCGCSSRARPSRPSLASGTTGHIGRGASGSSPARRMTLVRHDYVQLLRKQPRNGVVNRDSSHRSPPVDVGERVPGVRALRGKSGDHGRASQGRSGHAIGVPATLSPLRSATILPTTPPSPAPKGPPCTPAPMDSDSLPKDSASRTGCMAASASGTDWARPAGAWVAESQSIISKTDGGMSVRAGLNRWQSLGCTSMVGLRRKSVPARRAVRTHAHRQIRADQRHVRAFR